MNECAEDSLVGLLSDSVFELGEGSVAGCTASESARPGYFMVVPKAEGQPPVAGDSEEVFDELRFEH